MTRLHALVVAGLAAGGCSSPAEGEVTCSTAPSCSDDGYRLEQACSDGSRRVVTDCLNESGQLCEGAACVAPWRYGAPEFGRCTDDPLATPETLAEKAAFYDEIAVRLHVHPTIKQAMAAVLRPDPDDPTQPAVPMEQASFEDVETWLDDNHNGIWSGFYLASQAYRYAVTHDAEALATIRLLLEGDRERLVVTGVAGLYSRGVRHPGNPGHPCPADEESYTVSPKKYENRTVAVRDDGCAWVIDDQTKEWTKRAGHCGLEWLAGGCFVDNVSKDVTVGHVYSLKTVYDLVDDAEIRTAVAERLAAVAAHIVEGELTIRDWDGQVTGSGKLFAMAFDDYPGFNAAMALNYVGTGAAVSSTPELRDYYERCLLQSQGEDRCIAWPTEDPKPYTQWLSESHLFQPECRDNFCSHSMQHVNLFQIVGFEREPSIRETVQGSFDVDWMRAPGQKRAGLLQKNAWFDVMWAAHKRLGPGSDGPAFEAVEEAICILREFPSRYGSVTLDPLSKYEQTCANRGDMPSGETPLPIADRCPDVFVWWHTDPYELTGCTGNARLVYPPQGFLLPYWMGRYYGFIAEDL